MSEIKYSETNPVRLFANWSISPAVDKPNTFDSPKRVDQSMKVSIKDIDSIIKNRGESQTVAALHIKEGYVGLDIDFDIPKSVKYTDIEKKRISILHQTSKKRLMSFFLELDKYGVRTIVIQTPSGGFHVIFKDTKKLLKTCTLDNITYGNIGHVTYKVGGKGLLHLPYHLSGYDKECGNNHKRKLLFSNVENVSQVSEIPPYFLPHAKNVVAQFITIGSLDIYPEEGSRNNEMFKLAKTIEESTYGFSKDEIKQTLSFINLTSERPIDIQELNSTVVKSVESSINLKEAEEIYEEIEQDVVVDSQSKKPTKATKATKDKEDKKPRTPAVVKDIAYATMIMDMYKFIYVKQTLYVLDNGCYTPVHEKDKFKFTYELSNKIGKPFNETKDKSIIYQLQKMSYVDMQSYKDRLISNHFIPCRDGIIDVNKSRFYSYEEFYGDTSRNKHLIIHHKLNILGNVQLEDVDKKALNEVNKYFNDLSRHFIDEAQTKSAIRPDLAQCLLELLAYCCTTDVSMRKLFLLIDDDSQKAGSQGKSQYMQLIQKCIGQGNYQSIPLNKLVTNKSDFIYSALEYKLVNFSGEVAVDELYRKEQALKQLSGGDTLSSDVKHGSYIEIKPTFKLIAAGQEMPTTSDRSKAFFDRMFIIPFSYTIPDTLQQINISDRLTDEGNFGRGFNYEEKTPEEEEISKISEALSYVVIKTLKELPEKKYKIKIPECSKVMKKTYTLESNVISKWVNLEFGVLLNQERLDFNLLFNGVKVSLIVDLVLMLFTKHTRLSIEKAVYSLGDKLIKKQLTLGDNRHICFAIKGERVATKDKLSTLQEFRCRLENMLRGE